MEERYSQRLTRQFRDEQPFHLRIYNKVSDFVDDVYWAFVQEEDSRKKEEKSTERETRQRLN